MTNRGLRCKVRLLERGISQQQLAKRLGTTEGYLSRVIAGRVTDRAMRSEIAAFLHVPERELFGSAER